MAVRGWNNEARVIPEDVIANSVLALGTHLRRLSTTAVPARDWLEASPLLVHNDIEAKLRRTSLDHAIDDHLDSLEDVCRRPVDRLRTVNRLVPVGAVRQIVPATIVRLASHSEDWNQLRPDTVEPKVVLTPFRDIDLDFYENRVAVRLVDNLWQEVSRRLHAVREIETGVANIDEYVAQALGRPYRMQNRLFRMIADMHYDQAWRSRIRERREELAGVLDRIESLRGDRVLPGVNRNAEIGTALRTTNLFVNEHRYRRMRDLWRTWVADHTGAGDDSAMTERMREFGQAFTTYTALLLLHALDHLGIAVEQDPLGPGRVVRLSGNLTSLEWSLSGSFDVETGTGPLLRILPVPHAFTRRDRANAATAELRELTSTRPDVPTIVVYPGSISEREALPTPARLASFSGFESISPGMPGYGVLPVSPVEIDSVLRLARSIRLAVEQKRTKNYPVMIGAASSQSAVLAAGWLRKAERGLEVIRPPADSELNIAHTKLEELRRRVRGQVHLKGELESLDRLGGELRGAAQIIAALTTCPVCKHERPDSWRALRPRDDGSYECDSCQNCQVYWEVRRCLVCKEFYPVLRPDPLPDPGEFDGDTLDKSLGSSMLAAPCWVRPSVCICPSCGKCGEMVAGNASKCARCVSSVSA